MTAKDHDLFQEKNSMWRVARSLEVLRNQVNAAYPGRRKEHDGTIGDAAHQAQMSDHNPWVKDGAAGVVTALDITHDPAHGVDTYAIAETLRRNRDHRIKYIISNRRIFSSQLHAWEWHPTPGQILMIAMSTFPYFLTRRSMTIVPHGICIARQRAKRRPDRKKPI
ncbi:MAG: hypothetical protein JO289_01130 [Xanthobacteraceae bacterium]|nr:hypothetical protein [Xanthobacteraceae bacterium]